MSDNELIKALECAIEYGCGHYIEIDAPTIKNTLDLINRQKAEIERLRSVNLMLSQKRITLPERIELVDNARAKAIKDFAERLKELINPDWCKIHQQIDNIAKEMIGEQQ